MTADAKIREEPGCDDGDPRPSMPDPLETIRTSGLPASVLLNLELPPPEEIVPGIWKRTSGLIAGPPNGGKSLVAIDKATHAAALGFRVGLMENEGDVERLQNRVRRSIAFRFPKLADPDKPVDPDKLRIWFNLTHCNLASEQGVTAIIEEVKANQLDLLFIDSTRAFAPGVDENSSVEQALLYERIHRIKMETGAAVWCITHLNKATWERTGRKQRAPTLADLPGHGSGAGRIDMVYGLIQTESNAAEIAFDIYDLKGRDTPRGKPRHYTISFLGPEAVLREFSDSPASTVTSTGNPNTTIDRVRSALPLKGAGHLSQNKVVEASGIRYEEVTRALAQLVTNGEAENTGTPQRGRWVRLPPPPPVPPGSTGGTLSLPVSTTASTTSHSYGSGGREALGNEG